MFELGGGVVFGHVSRWGVDRGKGKENSGF